MTARYALATDFGRERENNEDAAQALPDIGLFVIADGMGGHVAGEVASRIAIESVVNTIKGNGPTPDLADDARLLTESTLEANAAVLREAEERGLKGMGTTLTTLRIRSRTATVSHVGDSRVYFLKDGQLSALTRDHNIASLLVDQGLITAEDARNHPERHMLTQAVGTQEEVEPDMVQKRIPKNTRILLSTDGLHDVVPSEEIAEIAGGADLEAAAQTLIERANGYGGPDNITVILIDP